MKPHKYAARRTTKENQMIATIGTGGSGVGPSGQGGGGGGGGGSSGGPGMGMQPQSSSSSSSMYERGDPRHTQVKTYTDHGNGHSVRSTGGPTQYSKVGRSLSNVLPRFTLSPSLGFWFWLLHFNMNTPILVIVWLSLS